MTSNSYKTGFVYVLKNQSMPDLVKVGLTKNLPEDRAKGLYTTGVPTEFNVAFRATTSKPREVEKQAHILLNKYRVNPRREYFRVSEVVAIKAVREALLSVAGIDSWKSTKKHNLVNDNRISLTLEKDQVLALINYKDMSSVLSSKAEIIDLWQCHSDGDLLEIHVTNSPAHVAGLSNNDKGYMDDPVPYLDREKTVRNGSINGRERLLPGERLVWIPKPNDTKNQDGVIFEARDYCQIISRTWDQKTDENGYPLLLNCFSHNDVWKKARAIIEEALSLEAPNAWVSRYDILEAIGKKPPTSEYWLPQLVKKKR